MGAEARAKPRGQNMLTGIALGLFLVLNIALTTTAVTLSRRHMRRTLTIQRRLGL